MNAFSQCKTRVVKLRSKLKQVKSRSDIMYEDCTNKKLTKRNLTDTHCGGLLLPMFITQFGN